jgi:hypothetical protein
MGAGRREAKRHAPLSRSQLLSQAQDHGIQRHCLVGHDGHIQHALRLVGRERGREHDRPGRDACQHERPVRPGRRGQRRSFDLYGNPPVFLPAEELCSATKNALFFRHRVRRRIDLLVAACILARGDRRLVFGIPATRRCDTENRCDHQPNTTRTHGTTSP